MPIDYSRYPADWKAISQRVRDAADNRCEWCGVENGATGYREQAGTFVHCEGMEAEVLALSGVRMIRIVLTVAHLGEHKHDKHRTDNLAALCQRCHLLEDLDDHIKHAAETRRRRKIEAGQLALMEA